jgi:hypothetical protein
MTRLRGGVLQQPRERLERLQEGVQADERVLRLPQGDQERRSTAEDIPGGQRVLWGLEYCPLRLVLGTVLQPEVGEVFRLLEALITLSG